MKKNSAGTLEDIYTNQPIDFSQYTSTQFSVNYPQETVARMKIENGQWKDIFITEKYNFFCERDQS